MREVDVIADVRAIRDKLAIEYGSVRALCEAMRKKSKAAGRKTVSFPKREPLEPILKKPAA